MDKVTLHSLFESFKFKNGDTCPLWHISFVACVYVTLTLLVTILVTSEVLGW